MKLQRDDWAPQFTLQNQDGIDVSLKDFLGKIVVLYFYPKDNTPGCSLEAQEFSQQLALFQAQGACVIGVSADSIQSHKRFIQNKSLSLMLLSDPTRSVALSYGAYGSKMLYGKEVKGIIRSTFLISPEGKILEAFYNVKAKGHAQSVLERLEEIRENQ